MKTRHFAALLTIVLMMAFEGCAILVPPPFINAETEIVRDKNGKIVGSKYTRKVTGFTFEGDPETAESWSQADRTAWGTNTAIHTPNSTKPVNTQSRNKLERKKLRKAGIPEKEIERRLSQTSTAVNEPATYKVEQLPPPPSSVSITDTNSKTVYDGVLSNETNRFRVGAIYRVGNPTPLAKAELLPGQTMPMSLPEGQYYVEWYTNDSLSITAEPFSINARTKRTYKENIYAWVQRIYIKH